MTDSAPAPLTAAERVALRIAAEALKAALVDMDMRWDHLKETHPHLITSDARRGFTIARHWLFVRYEIAERNRNAQGV